MPNLHHVQATWIFVETAENIEMTSCLFGVFLMQAMQLRIDVLASSSIYHKDVMLNNAATSNQGTWILVNDLC